MEYTSRNLTRIFIFLACWKVFLGQENGWLPGLAAPGGNPEAEPKEGLRGLMEDSAEDRRRLPGASFFIPNLPGPNSQFKVHRNEWFMIQGGMTLLLRIA
jgi:hypothetical protein